MGGDAGIAGQVDGPASVGLHLGARRPGDSGQPARHLPVWLEEWSSDNPDWFEGGWLQWREEDRTYLDVRWDCVPVVDRRVLRLELQAMRSAGEPFHVELRLSPGPDAADLVQIVDISGRGFGSRPCGWEAHCRLNDIAREAIVQVKDDVVLDVNSQFLAMIEDHPEEVIETPFPNWGSNDWKSGAHRWEWRL